MDIGLPCLFLVHCNIHKTDCSSYGLSHFYGISLVHFEVMTKLFLKMDVRNLAATILATTVHDEDFKKIL